MEHIVHGISPYACLFLESSTRNPLGDVTYYQYLARGKLNTGNTLTGRYKIHPVVTRHQHCADSRCHLLGGGDPRIVQSLRLDTVRCIHHPATGQPEEDRCVQSRGVIGFWKTHSRVSMKKSSGVDMIWRMNFKVAFVADGRKRLTDSVLYSCWNALRPSRHSRPYL